MNYGSPIKNQCNTQENKNQIPIPLELYLEIET